MIDALPCIAKVLYPILKLPIPIGNCPAFTCIMRELKSNPCIKAEDFDTVKQRNTFNFARCYRKDRCLYDPSELTKSEKSTINAMCQRKNQRLSESVYPGRLAIITQIA